MSVRPESKHPDSRTVIGWSEYVDFPEWGILGVRAKVDTGARTSALHVEDIEALGDGQVRFHVVTGRKRPFRRTAVCAKVVKWGRVRSSSGHYTVRCFVKTRIRVGPVEKEVELSLVSREKMLYRMLLGRRALTRDFLVDVSRRRMLGGRRRAKKQRKKTNSP
ncbi:MAG: ATP-dependent zinc protease [Candidatus Hydrogenedentes bacterium]|nr:ATP-dependent zinc protease [Candidatus Hydrogenedentota bacterium]